MKKVFGCSEVYLKINYKESILFTKLSNLNNSTMFIFVKNSSYNNLDCENKLKTQLFNRKNGPD